MSIASAISALQGASSDIATAIAAKGVTVPSGSGFGDYATLIGQIPSGGGGGRLPSGYTELEYVQTNSQAYIDTGIGGATDLEITIKFSWHKYLQYGAVFGNYVSESYKCNRAILYDMNSFYIAGGNSLATSVSYNAIGAIHTLVVRYNEVYLNGIGTAISAATKTENSTNIALGTNKVGNARGDIGLRIYAFSVSKNNIEQVNFVPCINSNDVAGFYDLVNNVFKPSDTITPFVAGPTIN